MAVVGASPAGLRAAWAAASGGARTVVLEARPEIGTPEPPGIVAFEIAWTAAARPRPEATRRRLDGARVFSPAGHSFAIEAPALVLDRSRFDRDLARDAEAAGACLVTGVGALRARPDRSLAAGGLEAVASVVIFADGARSLARAFLSPVEDPGCILWGAMHEIRAPGADTAREIRLSVGSHAPGGRSQLTPLGDDRWAHWTFFMGDPLEARERARRALALDARRAGWLREGAPNPRFEGVAADPVHTIPRDLVADGIMVVGGAAGQGSLEGGLAAGEVAGSVASRAVELGRADVTALRPYERTWKARSLWAYLALKEAALWLLSHDDDAIDRVLAPWDGRSLGVEAAIRLARPGRARRAAALAGLAATNPRALLPLAGATLRA